jgi:endothelin-converting enzyme/putative endopeptidase
VVAVLIAGAGCHHRVRRSAGDEAPYPPLDEASLDRNVSACQDFYQFACGGWISEIPVPPDRTRWVRGEGEVEERNARLMRRILEDAAAGKVGSQDRFGRKAGDFYAACLDEADVEASGIAELQAEWARLDAISDRAELGDELARLAAMGLRAPLGARAEVDRAGPPRSLLVIGADGAGLAPTGAGERARPSLPPAAGADPEQPDPYAQHVEAMFRLGGASAAQLAQETAAAVELARSLAPSQAPPGAEPQRLDRAALQRLAPAFPWGRFLRSLGADRLDAVGVADAAFVARVGQAFQDAPVASWRSYLKMQLADAMAVERALPAPLVRERFRYRGTLGPAPAELPPRWRHCVAATARFLPFAAGGTFARTYLKPAGRDGAGWLITTLQRGMQVAIESAPWIDAGTQSRAADKLNRMVTQVGFPDVGHDYNALRVGRDSYFRNVLSAGRFEVAQEVARATRPVDRGEWLAGPFTARPEYWPDRNVACVPAGALQPPMYVSDAPAPVVFGAVGTAIARELAEAIQGDGRMRGPDGSEGDWWTPGAARAFEARTTCLVDQYSAYEPLPGVRLDGRRMLEATLADLAGLRAAYEAMRAERIAHPGPDGRVLGFTPDQQFFLGYAQSLCTSATEADVAEEAAHGARPPARFRVNGPLSNLPEFARAFRCSEGSPMVRPRAARCDIW